ncbi:hypothetical protein AB6A40_010595 [Gnathostoma spinigerum]|uniref:Uncharacterized protein n=1 Tax=Gnathostoma spinigerum TaxID=75299 RepID=A0ABD6EVH0_9BILA
MNYLRLSAAHHPVGSTASNEKGQMNSSILFEAFAGKKPQANIFLPNNTLDFSAFDRASKRGSEDADMG